MADDAPGAADTLADLRRVVALGERLASAADERALATLCAGAVSGMLSTGAAAFTTDRVAVCEGANWDATALAALRHAALDAFGADGRTTMLDEGNTPALVMAKMRAMNVKGALIAPLRVQREIVGALACPVPADAAKARVLLTAIAQLASAFLGALRVIDAIRVQTREVEALLEKRTRELRAAETHLIVSDRLAAIGTLAAGIGHEIANPLASVMLNNSALSARLARAGLPAGVLSDGQRLLAENDEALDRIRTIVGELRTFTRKDDQAFAPLDVRAVVESAVRLARAQLRGLEVRLQLPMVPAVNGSSARLGQVFLNLLVNAAQALAETPRPRIDVEARQVGEEVHILVTDNGPGIAPEHLARIFDIYFTTKAHGEGTGLGLTIAHDIVSRHGGRLEVESTRGAGATFRVVLPVKTAGASEQPAAPGAREATPAVKPARRRPTSRPSIPVPVLKPRLLIIDDEVAILRALSRELEEEFAVSTARSGDEALDALAESEFDAYLCDLNLLGENGLDVAVRLGQRDARIQSRVIYMSGGTLSDRARTAAAADPRRFVPKPFDVPTLVKLLKQIASG